MSFTLFVVVSI